MVGGSAQPAVSDDRVREILSTCLDGFSCSPGHGQINIVRGLLRYNDFASRSFRQEDDSTAECMVRFKKNLCLFFRALHFFEEFHGHRNFSQPKGFWGLIQQETRFLFEKPTGPVTFLWFLIEARETYGNTHPYTAIPNSHFPQYIHRLVFHWSSAIRQSREPDSRQKQSVDAKRLAERCAEWRMLLQTRQLADRADMSDILSESQNIGAIFPHTAHLEGALHTTPHRMRAGATDPLFKQEHADEAMGPTLPLEMRGSGEGEARILTPTRETRQTSTDARSAGDMLLRSPTIIRQRRTRMQALIARTTCHHEMTGDLRVLTSASLMR